MDAALLELAVRVFADPDPPGGSDGAYVFGQTADNEASVLAAARDLLATGRTRAILVPDSAPRSGYPGIDAWRARLRALGVEAARVTPVPTADHPILSTLSEAEAAVRFAARAPLRALHVIGAPFHQLRAVLTTVSVALREHPALAVHSAPGAAMAWSARVRHSQGTLEATRAGLIGTELERIARYTAKGDLAAAREVLAYLDRRDGGAGA